MGLEKKIINKTIRIKDVARARDKIVSMLRKEKNNSDLDVDFVIEEIQEAFDFDGEEEYD